MEARQIFLDILRALRYDALEGLWDFVKFYDTLDPCVLLEQLRRLEYGATKTALIFLIHFAPMLLKLGPAYGGPTESRGIGIVAGCGRSGGVAKGYSHLALDSLRSYIKRKYWGAITALTLPTAFCQSLRVLLRRLLLPLTHAPLGRTAALRPKHSSTIRR